VIVDSARERLAKRHGGGLPQLNGAFWYVRLAAKF
jgi:hypothetical protein